MGIFTKLTHYIIAVVSLLAMMVGDCESSPQWRFRFEACVGLGEHSSPDMTHGL